MWHVFLFFLDIKAPFHTWRFHHASPFSHLPMALTTSSKIKKIRPQLTDEQKKSRREKFVALTNDVEQARAMYLNKIQNISKKHGRYVFYSATWTLTHYYY